MQSNSKLFFYISFGVAMFLLWVVCQVKWDFSMTIRPSVAKAKESRQVQCSSVMDKMLRGSWKTLSYSEKDMHALQHFMHTARSKHKLPHGLQRADKRCGNVTFQALQGRMHPLHWFRALCNPDGDNPCCYHNQCVNRTVETCRCDHCHDLRQRIYAEFSEWKPNDSNCQIKQLNTPAAVCQVLHNMTIYMIGDSFMRHIYISLLYILRQAQAHGPFKEDAQKKGLLHGCTDNKQFAYLPMCYQYIDTDIWECNRTVRLKSLEYNKTPYSQAILKAINEIRGKNNSFLFLGLGIHNDFDSTAIINEILQPMHVALANSTWPRAMWLAMHAPGLLKTPRVPSQNRDSILKFNLRMAGLMQQWGIPIFDSFNLTDGVSSYDGAHYGKGINDVKAQVFLNYILELRQNKFIT